MRFSATDNCRGPLPANAAKAYNIRRAAAAATVDGQGPIGSIAPARTSAAVKPAVNLQQLVSGSVPSAVNFEAPRLRPSPSPEVFQMYTRAADKMEAATAVQIGRTLDVKA